MMRKSASPDPWIFPALKKLKASGLFMVGALSNTVVFPEGHPLRREKSASNELREIFDFFVSSAHVGLRKPDPRVYQLALSKANEFADAHAGSERGKKLGWGDGVKTDEVVFLDDIGENLREARRQGFRTIKVPLGKAYEAVEELEAVTGLKLAGEHPKIPVLPNVEGSRAKM
jgi:FMN phosphatase YigB (HAD superfamily)